MGHVVIGLPPYHCQYNSVELIYVQFKGEVAKNMFFPHWIWYPKVFGRNMSNMLKRSKMKIMRNY